MVRQLFEPLYFGQRELANTLPQVDYEASVFHLSPNGVERITPPFSSHQLWAERHSVFFAVEQVDATRRLFMFEPREIRLAPLDDEPAAFKTVLRTGLNSFAIFRALENPASLPFGKPTLNIFRFDFHLKTPAEPVFVGQQRLTASDTWDFLPVLLPARQKVVFLSRDKSGVSRLMQMDVDGQNQQLVLSESSLQQAGMTSLSNIMHLKALDNHNIAFASNPKGYYETFRYDFSTAQITPFETLDETSGTTETLLLGSSFTDGSPAPALLQLPTHFDLSTLVALVTARNPEVNRKRALFAASLMEAGQARLANYPKLNFAVAYTPLVGTFLDEPDFFTGDFLAEGIARGVIGLVQPIFNIKRNIALQEAAMWRARIAEDVLQHEINEQIAAAAEIYFEAQYLQRRIALHGEMLSITERRLAYYKTMREQQESLRLQLLAAQQRLVGLRSEQTFHRQRLTFLHNQLKYLCGLSERATLQLAEDDFALDEAILPPLPKLRRIALMNHPQMQAAAKTLYRAFYIERAGSNIRPELSISASYGQSRRDFVDAVDDYITLNLNGQFPTAYFKANELHRNYWEATKNAYRIEQESLMRTTALAIEEAYMDFSVAQHDFLAKKANSDYSLEKTRVSRLHNQVLSPYSTGGGQGILDENTALHEYLFSLGQVYKVQKDLAQRYAKVWRETGLIVKLPKEIQRWTQASIQRNKNSLWLWRTKAVIADDQALQHFIDIAKTLRLKRVYAYMYSDSRLLDDFVTRERFTLFLHACEREGIEVWGLLGEPEWIVDEDVAALQRGIRKINEYNAATNQYEPKLAGIKLDLEPHSLPGWNTDLDVRKTLNQRYLSLLRKARHQLDERAAKYQLPLWVDAPVKYFRESELSLLKGITEFTDGITLMCYYNNIAKVLENAEFVLNTVDTPLEIGLEFSPHAPSTDTLATVGQTEYDKLLQTLYEQHNSKPHFSGIALHDYMAFTSFLKK